MNSADNTLYTLQTLGVLNRVGMWLVGPWSGVTTYSRYDIVSYQGGAYMAIADSFSNTTPPPDLPANWKVIATDYGTADAYQVLTTAAASAGLTPSTAAPASSVKLQVDAQKRLWITDPSAISFPVFEYPNIAHNAGLQVNQRQAADATGVSAAADVITSFYDKWQHHSKEGNRGYTLVKTTTQPTVAQLGASGIGTMRLQQAGSTTLNAGTLEAICQTYEGYHWQRLLGIPYCVSFWARCSKIQTVGFSISNNTGSGSRTYANTIPITAANTWQWFNYLIPADSTGTWLTTTGLGARIRFSALAGTTFTSGAVNGSWASVNTTGYAPSGMTNTLTASGDYLEITGLTINPGIIPSRFNFNAFDEEMPKMNRYYWKNSAYSAVPGANGTAHQYISMYLNGTNIGNTAYYVDAAYAVRMRTAPAITLFPWASNPLTNRSSDGGGANYAANSASAGVISDSSVQIQNQSGGNLLVYANQLIIVGILADAEFNT